MIILLCLLHVVSGDITKRLMLENGVMSKEEEDTDCIIDRYLSKAKVSGTSNPLTNHAMIKVMRLLYHWAIFGKFTCDKLFSNLIQSARGMNGTEFNFLIATLKFSLLLNKHSIPFACSSTSQSSSSRAGRSPDKVYSTTISIAKLFTSYSGPRQKQEKNGSLKGNCFRKRQIKVHHQPSHTFLAPQETGPFRKICSRF